MKRRTVNFLKELLLCIMTLVMLTPVFYFAISAFKFREDIIFHPLELTPKMFTLENFRVAYTKIKLMKAFKNTATITVISMVIIIIPSSLAGFAIARVDAPQFKAAYKYMLSLMVLPFVSCLLPLVVILNKAGLYNKLLACILIEGAWGIPFATFLYTGFMKGLPKELEEAAMIDGCSLFGSYFRVFFPLMAPVTATCCIKSGIGIWQDYLISATFLNSAKTPTIMVSVNKFFGQYVNEYGQSFAAVMMISIPTFVLFIFLQKYFIKGLAAGAVKG